MIDLNYYEDFTGEPIKFSQYKSTIFAKPAQVKKIDGMISSKRKCIAILRLKNPNIVIVR